MDTFADYFFVPDSISNLPAEHIGTARSLSLETAARRDAWEHIIKSYPTLQSFESIIFSDSFMSTQREALFSAIDVLRSKDNRLLTMGNLIFLLENAAEQNIISLSYGLAALEQSYGNSCLPLGRLLIDAHFKSLLIDSSSHAKSVGEALSLIYQSTHFDLIKSLGILTFVSMIRRSEPEFRHSFLTGLLYLFMSGLPLARHAVDFLIQLKNNSAKFALFWHTLSQKIAPKCREAYFELLLQNTGCIAALTELTNSWELDYALYRLCLPQIIQANAQALETINLLRSISPSNLDKINNLIEGNSQDAQDLCDIILMALSHNALSDAAIDYLVLTEKEHISILKRAIEHLEPHVTSQNFGMLILAKKDALCLSEALRRNATEQYMTIEEFYDAEFDSLVSQLCPETEKPLSDRLSQIFSQCASLAEKKSLLSFGPDIIRSKTLSVEEKLQELNNAVLRAASPSSCAAVRPQDSLLKRTASIIFSTEEQKGQVLYQHKQSL